MLRMQASMVPPPHHALWSVTEQGMTCLVCCVSYTRAVEPCMIELRRNSCCRRKQTVSGAGVVLFGGSCCLTKFIDKF